ncbi:hypothetical protein [Neolewinella agarilytica]|uniref:hypothetical protein n=1 Tax=Neolewinella agarilytica TaxID=478744 RepID=UPI0023546F14|nr:hypothetical protein [Neolewinella agarilytica]
MADYHEEIERLLAQIPSRATELEHLQMAENATRLADLHQDEQLAIDARNKLVQAAVLNGYPEKALVAYSYLLGKFDSKPELFGGFLDSHMLMWHYKWVIDKLPAFPFISRQQIEDTLGDLESRFQKLDHAEEAILQYRFRINSKIGEYERAEAALEELGGLITESSMFSMSDCVACFRSGRVSHYRRRGMWEKAIEEAQPILNGEETCGEIPSMFYDVMAIPYLKTGQRAEALALLDKMEQEDTARKLDITHTALLLHAVNDNVSRALELLERNWHLADGMRERQTPFDFFLAARFLLRQLRAAGREEVKLDLNEQLSFYRSENSYPVAELLEVLDHEIALIREAFNKRNGNDQYSLREGWLDDLGV